MTKNQYFHIKTLKTNSVLIIVTDVVSLDSYINEIEGELSLLNTNVVVYFDLLIKNGVNRRFYCADFDKQKRQVSFLKKCVPNKEILEYSNFYFKNNMELINESMKLQKAEKWWIRRNGTLKLHASY